MGQGLFRHDGVKRLDRMADTLRGAFLVMAKNAAGRTVPYGRIVLWRYLLQNRDNSAFRIGRGTAACDRNGWSPAPAARRPSRFRSARAPPRMRADMGSSGRDGRTG